jgi:hypothetical protein
MFVCLRLPEKNLVHVPDGENRSCVIPHAGVHRLQTPAQMCGIRGGYHHIRLPRSRMVPARVWEHLVGLCLSKRLCVCPGGRLRHRIAPLARQTFRETGVHRVRCLHLPEKKTCSRAGGGESIPHDPARWCPSASDAGAGMRDQRRVPPRPPPLSGVRSRNEYHCQQLSDSPDVVGETSCHGWGPWSPASLCCWFFQSTCSVLTGRGTLERASSRALAASRKRRSCEKESVVRTNRPESLSFRVKGAHTCTLRFHVPCADEDSLDDGAQRRISSSRWDASFLQCNCEKRGWEKREKGEHVVSPTSWSGAHSCFLLAFFGLRSPETGDANRNHRFHVEKL